MKHYRQISVFVFGWTNVKKPELFEDKGVTLRKFYSVPSTITERFDKNRKRNITDAVLRKFYLLTVYQENIILYTLYAK